MLASLLVGAGVYLGERINKKGAGIAPTPTPIGLQTPLSTQNPSPTPGQPTQASHFVVEAGGVNPFVAYTLSAITGWTVAKEHTDTSDKVTLTKGDYQLVILQTAMGGGACAFPGDTPGAMSISLTNPIDIPLATGAPLRRGTGTSGVSGKQSFTVCQKSTDGGYGSFTTFGAINYMTPLSPDTSVIAQMDAMVGSLQKQ